VPTSEDFAAEQWDSALVQPFLTCPSDLVDACNIWVVPAAPHWWQDDLCIDHDNADDSTEVASLRWHIYSAAVQLASHAALPAATEGCSASADARFQPERELPFLHTWLSC